MNLFPQTLEILIERFASLPGIGAKTAQRLAFHILSLTDEEAQAFADAVVEAKKSIFPCKVCQNLTDSELCPVCSNPGRDIHTICVVSDPKDVVALERGREYNGVYHVLHGVISPMNRVSANWSRASRKATFRRSSWRPIRTRKERRRPGTSRVCSSRSAFGSPVWPTAFPSERISNSPTTRRSPARWTEGPITERAKALKKLLHYALFCAMI